MAEGRKTFMVEGARIVWRNFSGKESEFNVAGNRNFAVVLDEPFADKLKEDGWNVKVYVPKDDEKEGFIYVPVFVGFKNYPPNITLITANARTRLDEASVDVLDWADILTVDFIASGYDWIVNGKTGTKAYLQTMFVTINENELERKYAAQEDSSG